MAFQSLGHRDKLSYTTGLCLGTPFPQEVPRSTPIALFPEFAKLFLEHIGNLQRLVDLQTAPQTSLGRLFQIVLAVEKQPTQALDGLFGFLSLGCADQSSTSVM